MSKINGRTEDKDFERLLDDLTVWFINNQLPMWCKALIDAGQTTYQQIYSY